MTRNNLGSQNMPPAREGSTVRLNPLYFPGTEALPMIFGIKADRPVYRGWHWLFHCRNGDIACCTRQSHPSTGPQQSKSFCVDPVGWLPEVNNAGGVAPQHCTNGWLTKQHPFLPGQSMPPEMVITPVVFYTENGRTGKLHACTDRYVTNTTTQKSTRATSPDGLNVH